MNGDRPPPGPEYGGGVPPAPESPATPSRPPAPAPYQRVPAYERGRPLPIREMRVGELLDAAIKIYRLHWKTFVGIAAYILVPLSFAESFFTRSQLGVLEEALNFENPSEPETAVIVASLLFGLISFLFVLPFLTGAFTKVTADLYLGGSPEVGPTLKFALSKTAPILLVSILTGLAVAGGLILLIVPAFIFYVRFVYSPVAVVAENHRGTGAMRRSWRLAKGFFWKTAGTLILALILSNIVGALLSLPLAIAADVIGPEAWALAGLGDSLGAVVTTPFLTIVVALLYFDLRIRKEGLDLALMVEDMSASDR